MYSLVKIIVSNLVQWIKGSYVANCVSDLIPGLGIPLATGWPQKKNNNDIHETPKIT